MAARSACRSPRAVLTRPVPKYACQTRLTMDRAVVGDCGRPASARTSAGSAGRPAGSGCRNAGHARRHRLARLEEVAALQHVRLARLSRVLCSTSCDEPSGCCCHSASISSFASFHSGTVVRQ